MRLPENELSLAGRAQVSEITIARIRTCSKADVPLVPSPLPPGGEGSAERGTALVSGTGQSRRRGPRDSPSFHPLVLDDTRIWLCGRSWPGYSLAGVTSSANPLGTRGSSRRAGRRATTPAVPRATAGARPSAPCPPVITPALCPTTGWRIPSTDPREFPDESPDRLRLELRSSAFSPPSISHQPRVSSERSRSNSDQLNRFNWRDHETPDPT